jgi:hypothetical protein
MGPVTDDLKIFKALYDDADTHAPEGRVLYLSRHGESEFNLYGKIGVRTGEQFSTGFGACGKNNAQRLRGVFLYGFLRLWENWRLV